jgi:hypothetical protein
MNQIFNSTDVTLLKGLVKFEQVQFPNATFGSTQFSASDPLVTSKQKHLKDMPYTQKHGAAVVTERRPVYIAKATGTIAGFAVAVSVIPIGDSTVTVDLLKNGATVLSAVVTIDSGNVAYVSEPAGIAGGGTYVSGDMFEVNVTATVGTGTLPQGLIAQATFNEDPS